MAKQIMFDNNGRQAMQGGMHKLARTVRVTLGPTGRNVMMGLGGKTKMTKDGETVSREITVENPFENLGARLMSEVSSRTNKEAGDGTTTSIVLADALVQEGNRFVLAGVSPIALRNGMMKATKKAIEFLEEMAVEVEGRKSIEHVATVASNNDKAIGKVLADAMTKVGDKGVITLEKGDGVDVVLDYVPGMAFDKGFVSPYFVTDKTSMTAVLEKPYILITDHKISSVRDLVPVLEKVRQAKRPLLIIGDDIEGEALAGLLINRLRGIIECCAAKAPAFGDRRKAMLEDLAIATGGKFLSKDLGFEWDAVELSDLGQCQRIEVEQKKTVFYKGKGNKDELEMRKQQIEAQLESTTSEFDAEKLDERLARLEGKIAVIKVGGYTEGERKEKHDRVEDALNATRAAVEEGIVPGAGTAFLRAIPAVESTRAKGDEKFGVEILVRALRKPLEQIGDNVGIDGPALAAEVEEAKGENDGYNGNNGKIQDLMQAGVVDPAKVLRIGLQNAVSIATLALISDAMVADLEDEEHLVQGAET